MEREWESLGSTLLEAFRSVPDPRKARGKRHPLPAILTLATCAMLSNCHSLYAIMQWGREHSELAETLGFTRKQTPAVSTLHQVFSRLDRVAFEGALRDWAKATLSDGEEEAIAIDGKSLRGIHGEELPGVHLVAAYAQKAGLVLAQKGGRQERGGVECSSGTIGFTESRRSGGDWGCALRSAESE